MLALIFFLAVCAAGWARAADARHQHHENCVWVAAMAEATTFDLHDGFTLARTQVSMIEIAPQ
jgi:hypothetical protein